MQRQKKSETLSHRMRNNHVRRLKARSDRSQHPVSRSYNAVIPTLQKYFGDIDGLSLSKSPIIKQIITLYIIIVKRYVSKNIFRTFQKIFFGHNNKMGVNLMVLGIIIGLFVGANVSFILYALLSAGKQRT